MISSSLLSTNVCGSKIVCGVLLKNVSSAYFMNVCRTEKCRWMTTVKVPTMGESITEGTISQWKKNVGERVKKDEVIALIDTDKVSVEINSPVDGVLKEVDSNAGDIVFVGKNLCTIDESDSPSSSSSEGVMAGDISSSSSSSTSLTTSKDDSPRNNIISDEIRNNNGMNSLASPHTTNSGNSSNNTQKVTVAREEKRSAMTRMRRRIAERLKEAQTTAACLTTFQEVDMSPIMKVRKEIGPQILASEKTKLGFMPFFMHACTKALEKNPSVNSRIDGTDLVTPNFVDLSIAVATPTGLTVPVIRDADKKGMVALEKELASIAGRARNNQLSLEEMTGGTFTISNGGIYGSLMGTPILNPPQSAILGMHSIVERPVVRDGIVQIRPMMYLALTYDHRVVDGREAVTFLKDVVDFLESPSKLLTTCFNSTTA